MYSTQKLVPAFEVAKFRSAAKYKFAKSRPCCIRFGGIKDRLEINDPQANQCIDSPCALLPELQRNKGFTLKALARRS